MDNDGLDGAACSQVVPCRFTATTCERNLILKLCAVLERTIGLTRHRERTQKEFELSFY